jgi:ribosome modulation factor
MNPLRQGFGGQAPLVQLIKDAAETPQWERGATLSEIYWVAQAKRGGQPLMPPRRCALLAGYYAARAGKSRAACPFADVELAQHWLNGHKTAPRSLPARAAVTPDRDEGGRR